MQLRIPGPTPLPDEVLDAMHRPMISHRGAQFREIMRDVTQKLQTCFQTEGEVLIFPGAGTGGLEAAIVNLFSPGDRIIALTAGAFGERFAEIAERFGLDVMRIESAWGQSVDLARLQQALEETAGVRGVLITHNETSTGVQNDVQKASQIIREQAEKGGFRPLLVVDAVSSLGAVDIPVDKWEIDTIVTASQKAWMAAPGLTMLAVSERAWEANSQARLPRFYWDFAEATRYLRKWETPYTPAVSLLYGLQESLRLITDEGLPNVFARHERLRDLVRGSARKLDLRLFAADEVASRTLTAMLAPAHMPGKELVNAMRERGIVIAGGQGPYEDKIVRIGHMGFAHEDDMREVLTALGDVLSKVSV
jgi:aspartate aminotransferase-like enzyme